MSIDPRTALRSLASSLCPACEGSKSFRHSLCRDCFMRLPQQQRALLYARVGHGYERALAVALSTLGVVSPMWPEEPE